MEPAEAYYTCRAASWPAAYCTLCRQGTWQTCVQKPVRSPPSPCHLSWHGKANLCRENPENQLGTVLSACWQLTCNNAKLLCIPLTCMHMCTPAKTPPLPSSLKSKPPAASMHYRTFCQQGCRPASSPGTHLLVCLDGEVVDVSIGTCLQPLQQLALNGSVQPGRHLSLGLPTPLSLFSPASSAGYTG